MEMHIIQKHILRRLAQERTLRYAEIKPPQTEGNQFSYHLKTLMRRGYVVHKEKDYALTTKGLHYATQVSFEHFSVRMQPKITTLIVCKNNKGEYLIYTRNKQPFLNMEGFPYGKVHLGERVAVAAERELKEKAGISADLKQKGILYLLVTDSTGEVIAHTLFHIFLGTKPKGEIVSDSPIGKIHWLPKKELLQQNIMPGVPEVLRMAEGSSRGLLFAECEFQQA